MESATAENEASVRAARQRVAAAEAAGTPVSRRDAVVEDVYRLLMEANSGASFEQYFRWATAAEIGRIVTALHDVGLADIGELTERAIAVAFPGGVPADPATLEAATDWSDEQEQRLSDLFDEFEQHNGRILNALGRYASGSLD